MDIKIYTYIKEILVIMIIHNFSDNNMRAVATLRYDGTPYGNMK